MPSDKESDVPMMTSPVLEKPVPTSARVTVGPLLVTMLTFTPVQSSYLFGGPVVRTRTMAGEVCLLTEEFGDLSHITSFDAHKPQRPRRDAHLFPVESPLRAAHNQEVWRRDVLCPHPVQVLTADPSMTVRRSWGVHRNVWPISVAQRGSRL